MNILHVIPSVAAADGGPSRAMIEIERALAARGLKCTTVTSNAGLAEVLPLGRPVATAFAMRWYFPATTGFYKASLGLARWLARNIGDFDVLHAHALFSFAPVIAAHLARRAGVPYVLRPLGVLNAYGMQERRPWLKKLSLALIERRLIESAGAVHFTSIAEQTEAEALGLRCKSVVIPLGVELPQAGRRARKRGGPFVLLFLGRIDPKKNIESLLRALARLPETVRLQIAGNGAPDYVRRLRALAAELGVEKRVEWLGYVEGARKAAALERAQAFVLPSHSENFGIAVVEALACGLPCVVSQQVAIAPAIAQARAGIVTGQDPVSIAKGIDALRAGPAGYRAMSAAARTLAQDSFSSAAMGERLEALYRGLARAG